MCTLFSFFFYFVFLILFVFFFFFERLEVCCVYVWGEYVVEG